MQEHCYFPFTDLSTSIPSICFLFSVFHQNQNNHFCIENRFCWSTSLQQLSLRSNPSLVGSIPAELFSSLSSLQILTVSQCRISGTISPEIAKLRSLVHLDLSYNQISGAIPVETV
ncbi:hypothetical protein R6Q57_012802 [Mikania cordata]